MRELIPIVMFVSVAAVMILRPLTTRLGRLLEAIAHEKSRSASEDVDMAGVRRLIEHLNKRMDLVEERLDFTERLVSGSHRTSPAISDRVVRERSSI